MTFIRSRLALTLIGLFIIGGVSAALAAMTAPHPLQAALIGTGQTSALKTMATATSAASVPGGASTSAPAAPTNTPPPAPTARPTTPPDSGGQSAHPQGTVASVNTSAGTFIMTTSNGSSVTIVVTGSTIFNGSVHSLSALRAGQQVEVLGTLQENGSVLASDVNADSGN